MEQDGYIVGVEGLTSQERRVIGVVLLLLLTGGATKLYRAAHPLSANPLPRAVVIQSAKP